MTITCSYVKMFFPEASCWKVNGAMRHFSIHSPWWTRYVPRLFRPLCFSTVFSRNSKGTKQKPVFLGGFCLWEIINTVKDNIRSNHFLLIIMISFYNSAVDSRCKITLISALTKSQLHLGIKKEFKVHLWESFRAVMNKILRLHNTLEQIVWCILRHIL